MPNAESLSLAIALPTDFRANDVLDFHRRDSQAMAERVTEHSLEKGLVWCEQPACLTINFRPGCADVVLAVDGDSAPDAASLQSMVSRMLGLLQPIEAFAQTYQQHPQLGPLIARHPGLRVPATATPFEAIIWAVTGQQISVAAAVSLRRKLILAVDMRHSSGLRCFPEAAQIAGLDLATLRQAGYSAAKAETVAALARMVGAGQLQLDSWLHALPIDAMREQLSAVRGIGPWTINYALLRGFGWLDGSLHGDVAVRRGLQNVLGATAGAQEKISETQAKQWLAPFTPWRALVAAHLWKAS